MVFLLISATAITSLMNIWAAQMNEKIPTDLNCGFTDDFTNFIKNNSI